MSDDAPLRPSRRKRVRLGDAFRALRSRVTLWRTLFVVTVLATAALLAYLALSPDGEVLLGKGRAGITVIEEPDPARAGSGEALYYNESDVGSGEASYYSDDLVGSPTASGEPFDPAKLTAAHRTLPLGSRVRVTNTATGKTVVVRVNDRGPYHERRIIDLSWAAARRIGLHRSGTARVKLELLLDE